MVSAWSEGCRVLVIRRDRYVRSQTAQKAQRGLQSRALYLSVVTSQPEAFPIKVMLTQLLNFQICIFFSFLALLPAALPSLTEHLGLKDLHCSLRAGVPKISWFVAPLLFQWFFFLVPFGHKPPCLHAILLISLWFSWQCKHPTIPL